MLHRGQIWVLKLLAGPIGFQALSSETMENLNDNRFNLNLHVCKTIEKSGIIYEDMWKIPTYISYPWRVDKSDHKRSIDISNNNRHFWKPDYLRLLKGEHRSHCLFPFVSMKLGNNLSTVTTKMLSGAISLVCFIREHSDQSLFPWKVLSQFRTSERIRTFNSQEAHQSVLRC